MQPIEKEKVFSKMLKAGKKTYFFDVKKASNGNNYLTIAESYLNKDNQKVINRIILFKDYFAEFGNNLLEMKQYMQ